MNERYRQMQIAEQFPEFPTVLTDEERYDFISEKNEFGCVMRSLESVTGVQGSYAEWSTRVVLFEDRITRNLWAILNQAIDKRIGVETLTKDTEKPHNIEYTNPLQEVMDFYQQISEHNSPLGRMMQNTNISYRTNSGSVLIQELTNGENIILSSFRHVAHVGLEEGKVVSISDNREQRQIHPDTQYDYIALTQKPGRIEF